MWRQYTSGRSRVFLEENEWRDTGSFVPALLYSSNKNNLRPFIFVLFCKSKLHA